MALTPANARACHSLQDPVRDLPSEGKDCIYCICPVIEVPENEQEQFCLQCNKAKVRKGFPNGGGPAEQDCQDCQDEHPSRATVTASEDDHDTQEPCVPKVVSRSSPAADLDFGGNEQSSDPIPDNIAMCGTGLENEPIDSPDDPSTRSPKNASETTGNASRPIEESDPPPTASEVPTASHPTTTEVTPANVRNEFKALVEKCIHGPIQRIEERASAHKAMARTIDSGLESAIRHESAAEAAVAELERRLESIPRSLAWCNTRSNFSNEEVDKCVEELKAAQAKKLTATNKVVYYRDQRKSHDLKKPDVQGEKKCLFDRYPAYSTLMKYSQSLESEDRTPPVNKRRKTDGSRDHPWIVE